MNRESIRPPITVTHIVSGDLWAGAEVQVYNLCHALNASKEVAVTAVIFNPGILHDKLVELGLPVTLADESNTGAFAIAKAIAAHCKAQGTDIVHTHGFKENVLGVLGKELARVRYSVRTAHGNPEHKLSWQTPHKWVITQLDILLGRTRQQAVIAVSSQLENILEPLFPGKIHKIFNFVDIDLLQKTWPLKQEKKNPQVRLGVVGRLVPVKRVDIFIKTIALLNNQGYSCHGVVIGTGPLETQLRNLTLELNIGEHITFSGFVNPALEEIRKLDGLMMPSDHEGLPMTLLEAIALGIPVFAHNVGGIPEILKTWQYGFLIDNQSPVDYADKVKKFLPNWSKFTAWPDDNAPNLLLEFRNIFSSEINSEKYVKLYSKIYGS